MIKKYLLNSLIVITFLIFIFVLLFYLYYYFNLKYEEHLVKNYFDTKINKVVINNEEEPSYEGILEIPKINVQKGFYNINDNKNNVNKNIQILKNSTMPNTDNSLLVIAGHSGSGIHSYFTNLDKLAINDEIIIYYQNYKYIYEVIKYENIIKNGILEIPKSEEKRLILTTCNEQDKNLQLVITAKLKNTI